MHHPCTAAIVGFRAYHSFMKVSAYRPIIPMSCTESQTGRAPASSALVAAAWLAVLVSSR
jgi:hypothetical protein